MRSFSCLFAFCLLCVVSVGAFAEAPPPPPEKLAVRDLINRPDRWPAEITVNHDIDFGAGGIKKGQKVKVMQFQGQEVGIDVGVGDLLMAINLDECDLLEAANAMWAKLTPEQRALDALAVVKDASLWPAKVRCMTGFTLDKTSKNLPPNMEYELMMMDGTGVTLWATEDKAKLRAALDQTDVVSRARELVLIDPAKRPSRIVEALKTSMVDSDGKPVKKDDLDEQRIFALYYGASWCGPCRSFSPGFVKFVNDVTAANPKLTVVLMSFDEKDADMLKYMKEEKMPWAAVPMAAVQASPIFMGYPKGGIPQLVIVDRYGKVLADSYQGAQYVGPKRPMQALSKMLDGGAGK